MEIRADTAVSSGNPATAVKSVFTTEKSVLKKVQSGNKDAFRYIVEHYKGAAHGVALGFLRNQQDALDISQEAFIRAYRNIKSFNIEKPFYPWFYQILKNLCLDLIKKRKSRKFIRYEEEIPLYYEEENCRELEEKVWEAIESLPFEHREIIILRYFRQYSYKEIAEITQKPIGTVMSSLYYSKKKLKSVLKQGTKYSEAGRPVP